MAGSRWGLAGVFAVLLLGYVAGQLLLAAAAWRTAAHIGIGGDLYGQVVLAKDLVADVLPPPAYLVETHLLVTEAVSTGDPARRRDDLTRLEGLRRSYDERRVFWRGALPEGPLREALDAADVPARRYLARVEGELLPALERGDDPEARALLHGPLTDDYVAHRTAIDAVVVAADQWLRQTTDGAMSARTWGQVTYGALMLLITAAGFVLAAAFSTATTRRVNRTIDTLVAVADRDLRVTAPVDGEREFRQLGEALNATLERLREDLLGYGAGATHVDGAARALRELGQSLVAAATRNADQASVLHDHASDVFGHMQSMAAATEQMSATILEISRSSAEAARVASDAVTTSDGASVSVERLDRSSGEVGEVVMAIRSIAEKTNLLALNAAIEAARAGAAGKGFAVVANEVKDLARQTTRATEEIVGRIEAIQSDSRSTIDAIGRIRGVIGRVHELQSSISTAVDQQSAATNEIARSVARIASSSSGMTEAAEDSLLGARELQHGSSTLERASEELSALAQGVRDRASGWRTEAAHY
ncbi:MAG: methyl-accepting chemotaxis protein [Myxococcota bacterium]